MELKVNLLILDKKNSRCQELCSIFKFLGLNCKAGNQENLSQLSESKNNFDICILGMLNHYDDGLKLMHIFSKIPFLAIEGEQTHLIYKENFLGEIKSNFNINQIIALLRRCQTFIKNKHNKTPAKFESILAKNLTGNSETISRIRNLIKQVAPSNANVLIRGESGTGKELVARSIHELSVQNNQSFIKINCGTYLAPFLEHLQGTETIGEALNQYIYSFDISSGGTIFLDEIGDMSLNMQIKLLQILSTYKLNQQRYKRNIRIIAATNQNLEKMVKEKNFREDLYYRLNVFPIDMPPLRQRKEDIPELINDLTLRQGAPNNSLQFTAKALECLKQYLWPGNIRELKNLISQLLILHPNELIDLEDLPKIYQLKQEADIKDIKYLPEENNSLLPQKISLQDLKQDAAALPNHEQLAHMLMPVLSNEGIDLKAMVADVEINMIKKALIKTSGNVSKAAIILSLRRTTLVEKIKKYKI